MKKFLPVPCILFFAATFNSYEVYSQLDKGRLLISGNIAYSRLETGVTYRAIDPITRIISTRNRPIGLGNLSVKSRVGYFLVNKLAIGVSFPVVFTRQIFEDAPAEAKDRDGTIRTLAIGPFARYYVPVGEKVFVFGEASCAWGSSRSEGPSYIFNNGVYAGEIQISSKQKSKQFQGGAGLAYFLNRNTGLEFMINYQQNRTPSIRTQGIVCSLGFQVYVGK